MANMESRITRALQGKKRAPVTRRELAKSISLRKSEKDEFLQALQSMKASDRLLEKGGRLALAESLGLVAARIVKVTGTFGFAAPEGWNRDVFVPGRMLAGAMPGDTVLLKITRGSGELPEGEVYKVSAPAQQRFTATLEIAADGATRVHPDKYVKFPLPANPRHLLGARSGDKVLCELETRGERHSEHIARVVEVFGAADSAAACCHAILAANGIPVEFPAEVREQARSIAAGDGIHPKELASRRDLREETIFTIDGADSKDLDDAVSLQKREWGWELGVHIADVSYYVTHGAPLDNEAFARGTSVYYADSVIPMLPEELSNGVCSLGPGEDRLTFSAILRLNQEGEITGGEFVKSVIRSRVKGVYSEVNEILAGTASRELRHKYDGMLQMLHDMQALAALLAENRARRGGVNLESTESKIVIGEDGRAVDVLPRVRGASEGIIEEFMLTANEAAATFALEKKLPFVYRVHDNPAPDKVGYLFEVLEQLGIQARRPKEGVSSVQLAKILAKVAGTPYERVVNSMVLRSMAKAKYSENCSGHFGLALHNYTHFTSPIRRYPDLTIHRILSGYVTGMKFENLQKRFAKYVVKSAAQSSEREIAAMTAERDCEDCYKAEYMQEFVGEERDGVITSVTAFGIYVQLPNTVEGLVHISSFPQGEWQPDGALAFVEARTGKRLRLGDTVRVRVAGADISAGHVDFVLV